MIIKYKYRHHPGSYTKGASIYKMNRQSEYKALVWSYREYTPTVCKLKSHIRIK